MHGYTVFPPTLRRILLLEARRNYDVIICSISIRHTTESAARASGLFGLLGDSPIHLIDPDDRASMQALRTLVMESFIGQNDVYFETLNNIKYKADFGRLSRNMQMLWESYVKVWVWCCWERDRNRLGSTWLDFDQVWSFKKQRRGGRLRPSTSDASKSLSPLASKWWIPEIRGRSPNTEHPWVAQILAKMPVFRLKILAMFCQDYYYDHRYSGFGVGSGLLRSPKPDLGRSARSRIISPDEEWGILPEQNGIMI